MGIEWAVTGLPSSPDKGGQVFGVEPEDRPQSTAGAPLAPCRPDRPGPRHLVAGPASVPVRRTHARPPPSRAPRQPDGDPPFDLHADSRTEHVGPEPSLAAGHREGVAEDGEAFGDDPVPGPFAAL